MRDVLPIGLKFILGDTQLTGGTVNDYSKELNRWGRGDEFIFGEGDAQLPEDGERESVVCSCVCCCGDEEGIVCIVRYMRNSLSFAYRFDRGGEEFIEGGARMNAE
jgi:hypothetical protein